MYNRREGFFLVDKRFFPDGVLVLAVLLVTLFLVIFLADNPAFITGVIKGYGVLGLFLASIIGTATILFPLPIDALILLVSAEPMLIGIQPGLFAPLLIAFIAGFGAAIGEMTSYILGLRGMKVVEGVVGKEFSQLESIRGRLRHSGALFIFFASLTPFPFDLAGIVAGLIKFDVKRFFGATLLGKLVRYFLIAYAGFFGWGLIRAVFLIH